MPRLLLIALGLVAGCSSLESSGPSAQSLLQPLAAPGLELNEVANRLAVLRGKLRELADPRFAASARVLIEAQPEAAHRLFFEVEDPALHTALLQGYRVAGEPLYAESERVRRLHPGRYHAAVGALGQARDAIVGDPTAARAILERVDVGELADPLLSAELALVDAALELTAGDSPGELPGGTRAQRAWGAWLALCAASARGPLESGAWERSAAVLQASGAGLLGERAEALREWHGATRPADEVAWLVWLTESALARRSYLSALRFAQRAARTQPTERGARFELALLRTRCLRVATRHQAAEAPLSEARELAQGPTERGAVAAEAGRLWLEQGEGEDQAADAFAEARDAAREAGDVETALLRDLDRCSALLQGYKLEAIRESLPAATHGEASVRREALQVLLDLADRGDTADATRRLGRAAERARVLGLPSLADYVLRLRERVASAG